MESDWNKDWNKLSPRDKFHKAFQKYRSHSTGQEQKIYQTTQIPLDLIEHFVKRSGLGDTFNVVHYAPINVKPQGGGGAGYPREID